MSKTTVFFFRGTPALTVWVDNISPVKVAAFQAVNQHLGGCNIGRNRNIMHVAKAQHIHLVDFVGLRSHRIPEKKQQVNFIAGNTGGNLLIPAVAAT